MTTTIIDLSVAVDPAALEIDPVTVEVIGHVEGGDRLGHGNGLTHRDFPDGKGLSLMRYSLTTHTGTHIDAPFHYGDVDSQGRPAPRVGELPLDWFYGDGVVLDVRAGTGPVTLAEVDAALTRIDYTLKPGDIVLMHTGGNAYSHLDGDRRYYSHFRGVTAAATEALIGRGIRVIGVDSFGFDPPFGAMIAAWQATRDPGVLWPAHVLGRRRPYIQIERLANLEALPRPHGFKVACFPIKLTRADAAWCRAVALIEE